MCNILSQDHVRRQWQSLWPILLGIYLPASIVLIALTMQEEIPFADLTRDVVSVTGVSVLVVRPGFVRSKMTEGLPDAPLATTPEAVADAIVDGVRRGRSTVWVPGAMRWVMSGLRHTPRAVFRRLPI